jgi:hypothetical protein
VRVPHDGVRCHRASVVLRAAVPLPIYVRHALRVAVGRWLVAARAARLHLLQLFGPVVMGSRLLVADRGGGPMVSRCFGIFLDCDIGNFFFFFFTFGKVVFCRKRV